jgi:CBS domain-containing protein
MILPKKYVAKDIMTTKLLTLHPNDKMARVKEVFEEYSVRHIPILVSDRIVGIISKSDFLQMEGTARDSFDSFLKDKMLVTHPVEKYMRHEVVCCDKDTPLEKIVDLFLANAIRSVLVVEEGSLQGIITPNDILSLFKKLLQDG